MPTGSSAMPQAVDTDLVNPLAGDALNAAGQEAHHTEHTRANDGLKAVERIVVGPTHVNVMSDQFSGGAKGDGTTDDTTAIQAALATGGVVHFPPFNFKISNTLTIASATRVQLDKATITQATGGKGCFDVTSASGATIRGGTLVGPQYASYVVGEKAIRCVGASGSSFTSNVVVQDVAMQNWGEYGVYLQYVTNFRIERCTLSNVAYAGVLGLSTTHGFILNNLIDMGTPVGTSGNAYGIALTRTDNDSLITEPRSADVLVQGNDVRNVTIWEGLDTHGGLRITFDNNHVYNCKFGVNCGDARNTAHLATWGSVDCHVTNNTLDSGVTDGSRGNGIIFHGDGRTLGSPLEKATGTIIGNTIRGHGLDTSSNDGGIYAYCTQGLVIANNNIEACGPNGICLDYDDYGCAITGNTVTDVWTSGAFAAAGVCHRSANNTVIAEGNIFVKDSKSATHVLDYAFHVYNQTGNRLALGKNHVRLATSYLQDDAGSGSVFGRLRSVITNVTPGAIAAGTTWTSGNVVVTAGGAAALNDEVSLGFNPALPDGCVGSAKVTASNIVKISISNVTAGALTPTAATTVSVTVTKPEQDG